MSGQLSEHPLAELLQEVCARDLSGTLRVEHEHSKVVIYLEEGRVIYAASNVRALRLAEYLKTHGLVSQEQLARFAHQRSDLALADALSADGVISKKELEQPLGSLTCDTLRLALLWTEGTWHYDQRARLDDSIRLDLDMQKLLLESGRKVSEKFATKRFPNLEEIIAPGSGTNSLDVLTPIEGFLLSRVDGDIQLGYLIALSGQNEGDALRTIYGLAAAGLLRRTAIPSVLSRQKPPAMPKPKAAEPPPPPAPPVRSEEDQLKEFLARIETAVSYYDVLNVLPDTSDRDIKQAYYGVARKYHPDRFRGKETEMHSRLESAFARITQAYETLTDPSRRRAHDSKLAAQEKSKKFARAAPQASGPAPQKPAETVESTETSGETLASRAEDSFKEGFAALQQGQMNLALSLLAAAARAVPNESRYRAYYGRALAAIEKTRRSAEAELQAAIRLDSKNASYHVMLAELYRDLGFARRALSEAQKALAIQPGNAEARDLVRTLK